ncbi:MAG: exodeoxyribonuclease VII small subunit [Bacteroidales bacterium]|nr:exodeoxyribonuclease VII small subunit [Bacteroidales bacterium]
MSTEKEIKYSDAIKELETILHDLEMNETDVDELSEKVKRASWLITFCKKRLTETENDVKAILDGLDSQEVG